jgi:hypothetical protein
MPVRLNSGVCVSACPLGYIQSTEEETECVVNSFCPFGFTASPTSNVECQKPFVTISSGEKCANGYEEWDDLKCYQNCPGSLISNGTVCEKQTITRDSTVPTTQCDTILFYAPYAGASCRLSLLGSVIVLICILSLLGIVFYVMNLMRQINPNIKKEEELIRQIDSYFHGKHPHEF